MQLDFVFLKFAKNLKNCSPTVLHLTYAFWQTWHLIDQTWHFCIGTMAWQFWYPENPGLLCRARTPHVAVVSHETTPPRARLFSFPRALPPFFTWGQTRSIAASFSCSDTRLSRADVAGLDQAATSFGDLEALLAEALGPGCRGAT